MGSGEWDRKEHRHYFSGGTGTVAVFTITEEAANPSTNTPYRCVGELHFLRKDHLGSTEVVTNELGQVLTAQDQSETGRYSFDAWGLRRNAQTWSAATSKINNPITNHGFTGHERLDHVELGQKGDHVSHIARLKV